MRISRIQIENFKSIKSLDLDPSRICCLVGPNNAGKSNILLAIQRVLGRDWVSASSFDEGDIYAHDYDSDVTIRVSFDPGIPYTKFKYAEPVLIRTVAFEYTRYQVGDDKGKPRLEQKCFDGNGKPTLVLVKAPKKGEARQFQPLVNIPSEVRESIPLIYVGTNRTLKEQLPAARHSMLRQLFEDINRDLQDPKQTVKVTRRDGSEAEVPRLERFQRLMEAAVKLLRTESFVALEDSIKRNVLEQLGLDPTADSDQLDLHFTPFDTLDFYKSLDLRIHEGAFSVSATELGEGVQNALVLAILKAFEERRRQGAILLIEEPEMFLHPQMQRSLYKTLREIAKTNQIIYTTHSPHFVSVPDYNELVVVRKGTEGTTVRCSDLPTNTKRREKLVKELDPERSELFFATRLLLVEGDTEKLALPEYAKRLTFDLDRAGATIVEVGGKRNLMEFAKIATSFEIPTGIVYDEDSSDFEDKDEEIQFNAALEKLARKDGSVMVWRFGRNFEDHLRKAFGDQKYQELCQKYPHVGKPTRARLIATEADLPIPDPVPVILSWLSNRSLAPLHPK